MMARALCVIAVPALAGLAMISATTAAADPEVPQGRPPEAPEPSVAPVPPKVSVQTTIDVTDEASYRAALTTLSADPSGPHTINVLADITLTGGTDPIYNNASSQPLTINGNGHTIDATHSSKILDADNGADLTINDLTAMNGSDDPSGDNDGGAIEGEGDVIVNGCTFHHNHAENSSNSDGGAIDARGITIINSTFESNSALAFGGAVAGIGVLTVDPSTFVDNTSVSSGGAIDNSGDTTIIDTTFEGNSTTGGSGGAVKVEDGTSEIVRSTFVENAADADGGGMDSDNSATITESTFRNNESGSDGGGADTSNQGSDLLVVRSTFNGNTAADDGGAMEAEDDVNVTNSTITDNTAGSGGGGINAELGDITLNYVTVVFNHDPIASDLTTQSSDGDLSSFASLVGGDGGGVNCVIGGATIASSYNFAEDDSCDFTGTGDRQNTPDPMIGALADNGGPTQTMLPQTGSPLIDQIPSSSPCAGVVILTDQRGVLRPQGPACDIGAVEVEVEVIAAVAVTPTFTG
jgi:hypothetical protein